MSDINFPELEIQCEEVTDLKNGEKVRCQYKATSMMLIYHYGPNCEKETLALCQGHAIATGRFIEKLIAYLQDTNQCRVCKQKLTRDNIAEITKI